MKETAWGEKSMMGWSSSEDIISECTDAVAVTLFADAATTPVEGIWLLSAELALAAVDGLLTLASTTVDAGTGAIGSG
jgi:hypothetical protein